MFSSSWAPVFRAGLTSVFPAGTSRLYWTVHFYPYLCYVDMNVWKHMKEKYKKESDLEENWHLLLYLATTVEVGVCLTKQIWTKKNDRHANLYKKSKFLSFRHLSHSNLFHMCISTAFKGMLSERLLLWAVWERWWSNTEIPSNLNI